MVLVAEAVGVEAGAAGRCCPATAPHMIGPQLVVPAGARRRPGRVPVQRHAVDRVQRAEAEPVDRAAAGRVVAVGVAQPAEVTADVDHVVGDLDGGHRVGAGVVDPGGVQGGAPVGGLEPGDRVAVRPVAPATVRDDDEVRAVVGEVDVPGVERERAAVAGRHVALGAPVGDRRGAVQVDDHHLVAGLAVDLGEVAHRDQGLAVGGDGEAPDQLAAGPGDAGVDLEARVDRAGGRVEPGQQRVLGAVDPVERAGDVELVADHDGPPDQAAVTAADPTGDRRAGGRVQLDEVLAADPVDVLERAADDQLAVRARREGVHRAVQRRGEVGLQRAAGPVVGEQVVAGGPARATRGLDGGEGATHVDGVPDLGERLGVAVLRVRNIVRRVRRREGAGYRGEVRRLGGRGQQADREHRHGERGEPPPPYRSRRSVKHWRPQK